jgi:EAL domain-containing protein (putative c-di-GMP-specific phosphodiesterase class I)
MTVPVHRFVSFAFASADVLIEVGPNGLVTFSMGACRALFGADESKLINRPFLDLFAPGDRGAVSEALRRLWPGARSGPVIARLNCGRENCRTAVLHVFRLPDAQAGYSCTISQTTLSAALEAEGGNRDTETGLLDGESFTGMAQEALRLARQTGDGVGMSLIDIPGLRGQPPGAPLVRRVGDLLRSASMNGALAGRLAETRFGVIHRAGENGLDRTLEDIRKEGAKAGADLSAACTGIDIADGAMSEEEAVKAVRFAVNRFAALSEGEAMPATMDRMFETLVDDTIRRMTAFVQTVRNNEFALTYQPIVEIASAKLHHFEVLARFEDGRSPFETIQFAEEIDLIERFDLAVCTRSIGVLNATLGQNPGLAVNLSGRSVSSPAFMRVLMTMLAENSHLGGRLSFEITESAQLRDLVKADQAIQSIRKAGFRVFLDDFGAGAASFQYLQALKVDGLKIDGEYVRRLADSVRDHTILVGMVRICKSLALESVAERVEDRDTAVALYEMGVRFGQGWYYGKPLAEPLWKPEPGLSVATGSAALPPPQPVVPSVAVTAKQTAKRRGETQSWG